MMQLIFESCVSHINSGACPCIQPPSLGPMSGAGSQSRQTLQVLSTGPTGMIEVSWVSWWKNPPKGEGFTLQETSKSWEPALILSDDQPGLCMLMEAAWAREPRASWLWRACRRYGSRQQLRIQEVDYWIDSRSTYEGHERRFYFQFYRWFVEQCLGHLLARQVASKKCRELL